MNVHYQFDNLNHIQNITSASKNFTYEYYADGNIKKVTYPNGITREYSYDNFNRLKTLQNKKGTLTLSSFSYDYDANSNITAANNNGLISYYEYDALDRLISVTNPDLSQIFYQYDSRGNRSQVSENAINLQTFIPGAFTYNDWGQLASFTPSEGSASSYTYDPEGLRTKKTGPNGVIRYICDNEGRVIAEADGNNQVTAEIIWGTKSLVRKVGTNYYYYLYNGHGDVIGLTNKSGDIINSYSYDAWGNITSQQEQISNPIKYAGEYYDNESGLYYLRANYRQVYIEG